MASFAASVLPAPDSPEITIPYLIFKSIICLCAYADTANVWGGQEFFTS